MESSLSLHICALMHMQNMHTRMSLDNDIFSRSSSGYHTHRDSNRDLPLQEKTLFTWLVKQTSANHRLHKLLCIWKYDLEKGVRERRFLLRVR